MTPLSKAFAANVLETYSGHSFKKECPPRYSCVLIFSTHAGYVLRLMKHLTRDDGDNTFPSLPFPPIISFGRSLPGISVRWNISRGTYPPYAFVT